MKKYKYTFVAIIIALTTFTGCKDDAYYGSELSGGSKTSIGFTGPEETKVVINSFEGTPKPEESVISIPVKIYSPLKQDITVKLIQNDALLDTYYKDSRLGLIPFPEGVLQAGSVTIPSGKTEGIIKTSLQNTAKLTTEGEYLAAFSIAIENNNTEAQIFGVKYHFVKAVQKRSENIAELSINQKEIVLTANDPRKETILPDAGINFTLTTSMPQDRKVRLSLQKALPLLNQFYKGDTEGFLPFPDKVLDDLIIEIPAGKTQVDITLPFAYTDKLIDEPGYLTAFKLKELSEDRRYVAASKDTYFFVKVKQTTSVGLSTRDYRSNALDKATINAFANGTTQMLPAVLNGNKSGDFFEITKSNNGSLELIFESSENVKDLTLQTNAKESGITSLRIAVTKDKGKTWLPRGMVKMNGAENEFNITFQPNSTINGIKVYEVKGAGSGIKIYEATPYSSWW